MTSYPSPTQRRSSLSPNSFLSPSRKRSFSATEIEPQSSSQFNDPKRLSSIKSILNPGSEGGEMALSPRRYEAVESPTLSERTVASGPSSGRDAGSESERAKADRREALRREAEKMREALAAKERELEELGLAD
jgi:GATA-binding protein